jgi:ElaB/YqjD/DUF883 family membrane-anchored ribosome-binding protein
MGLGNYFKNLFGSAKESTEKMVDKAEIFAQEASEKIREVATPLVDKLEDFAEDVKDKAEEYMPQAKEKIEEVYETAREKVSEYAQKAEHFTEDTITKVKDKVTSFTDEKTETEAVYAKTIVETETEKTEIVSQMDEEIPNTIADEANSKMADLEKKIQNATEGLEEAAD